MKSKWTTYFLLMLLSTHNWLLKGVKIRLYCSEPIKGFKGASEASYTLLDSQSLLQHHIETATDQKKIFRQVCLE